MQVASLLGVFAAWLLVDLPFAWAFAFIVCAAPAWQIERMRKQRVEKIEDQIDGIDNLDRLSATAQEGPIDPWL